MNDPPFTINDTPGDVRRIESDLSRIRDTVTKADPHLKSLVLTGGFARGEGAMIEGVPQNDYDLIAVRGLGRPRVAYSRLRAGLEAELAIHVDLATVQSWRLPFVSSSIFWYETVHHNRVLWGDDLMKRVRVRTAEQLDPREGLRLLTNRAAGLLLATAHGDAQDYRIQAAKALLAVADVHLLAGGSYRPSHLERREVLDQWRKSGRVTGTLEGCGSWLDWAFEFKVDPASRSDVSAKQAWTASARALVDAVPVALDHAGYRSLEQYGSSDGVLDHVYFMTRPRGVKGRRRFVRNPTGRIRVGTLRMLEDSLDGEVRPAAARAWFRPLVQGGTQGDTKGLGALQEVRQATLQ